MLWTVALSVLIVCIICQADVEEKEEYDNIQEVITNLSKIYEDPTKSTHRHLLETGILYLDKLLFLEDAVKEGVPKAERLIRKLHKDGAYDQLKSVPFKILINHYGWNSMEVAEYENMVHRAKEIWRYFLDEITYGSFEVSTTPVNRPKHDKNEDHSRKADAEEKDEYDNIQEVITNLTKIYEDPTKSTHRQLLETGILYLDKLLFLEDAVKEGVPKAERLIRKLHKDGAYEQLVNVPFSILIGHYGWNSMEVAEYENMVHRAKEIWRYFLDEITYGSFEASTTPINRPIINDETLESSQSD